MNTENHSIRISAEDCFRERRKCVISESAMRPLSVFTFSFLPARLCGKETIAAAAAAAAVLTSKTDIRLVVRDRQALRLQKEWHNSRQCYPLSD